MVSHTTVHTDVIVDGAYHSVASANYLDLSTVTGTVVTVESRFFQTLLLR